MSSRSVKTLPQEIIHDLLSRLPVKSLCRFRCVSKSWLALITDPQFIKSHLKKTQRHKLIVSSYSLYSIDHEATPIDEEVVAVELDYPLENNHHQVRIVGSCNGLLCIRPDPGIFFLFNPSTRESKRIPNCQVPCFRLLADNDLYGFGYAESIDDYKFVVVCGSNVCVFSLRTNSWTMGQDFHYEGRFRGRGTPLNGAIHWILNRHNGNCVLAAFDLVEDSFKELPLPDALTEFRSLSTGVLEGRLCVSHLYDLSSREFWVMKEYGVKESWSRVLIQDPYIELQPLCFWKSSKMLLAMNSSQLVLCDGRDGTCKEFVVTGIPEMFNADVYVESLVPPNYNNRN